MEIKMRNFDVIVIGGGAAGMFAACIAAEQGAKVLLLERNDRLGKKLNITGKGRCNVTNNCSALEVQQNIPRNGKFLYSALDAFPPERMMRFLEETGCPLKTERGNRVFPVSDKASSVIGALERRLRGFKVEVRQERVREILQENSVIFGVKTENGGLYAAGRVILATGGCSYPTTGSTGDGFRLAESVGHTIVPPVGSLVPLVAEGEDCPEMQGLSLRNVGVRLLNQKGKAVYQDFGELLFTHFGLSGPMILSASAHMRKGDTYTVRIDLKPALDESKLDARLLRDLEQYQNRAMENALTDLLPRSMIPVLLRRAGVDGAMQANALTRPQRRRLLEEMKGFQVKILEKRPVAEAIVTSGGVSVKEISPKTMESKIVAGLYFAGEVIDCDAYTGGFNLQIAWATGYAAGLAAANKGETQ
jgi:hypothetical protein